MVTKSCLSQLNKSVATTCQGRSGTSWGKRGSFGYRCAFQDVMFLPQLWYNMFHIRFCKRFNVYIYVSIGNITIIQESLFMYVYKWIARISSITKVRSPTRIWYRPYKPLPFFTMASLIKSFLWLILPPLIHNNHFYVYLHL